MPSFPSVKERDKHIRRHYTETNEFGVGCADEYVALAEAFSDGPWPAGVEDRARTDTKIQRYLDSCGWYAVVLGDRSALLTFHVLHPAGTTGVLRTHRFTTNREFADKDLIGQARP